MEDGQKDQVMVFMPPGSAKSTYASVLFPSHYLGRFPNRKVICASYETGLATQFGRKVRNLTEQDEYRRIFPQAGLTQDSKAKGEWELQNGSSYYGCGVGAGITGRRGDGAIIDDPVKGAAEAESETIRNRTWSWYLSDLSTRLKPDAWKIIIQTRWHEDDLSGHILPDDWDGESGYIDCGDHGTWFVLCLSAQAGENDVLGREPGEWLWTDYFTPEWWERTKRAQSPRVWSALYQQKPTADEGTFFRREWFWRFDPKDGPKRKYMTADFAVTSEIDANDPDYTSIGVHGVGQDPDGLAKLYLCMDGWRGRREVDDTEFGPQKKQGWINEYFHLQLKHKPMCEFAEVGVIRRAIEALMTRKRRERRAYGKMEWLSHIGDKMANARALQDLASMGQVGIANNEFGDEVLAQLLKFPAGKHDDDVDMCALMGRAIAEAHPMVETKVKPKQIDRWDRAFERLEEEGSWRV